MPIFLLSDEPVFPPVSLSRSDGLLAIGGDLSQQRLLTAYENGIFPWYSHGDPILWWSPDPRLILYPDEINISKRLKRVIKQNLFSITMDTCFNDVIYQCARIRHLKNESTWITQDMMDAYCQLHQSGYAHSVEVWKENRLAGGLYGISLGKGFFGESMFSHISNASKIALVALTKFLKQLNFIMIDCQVRTNHLISMGACEISRDDFIELLHEAMAAQTLKGSWSDRFQLMSG